MASAELTKRLLTAFRGTLQALHRGRMDRLLTEKLTMPQFKVLLVVARDGGTVGGLARHLSLSAPTMTGIIDRLNAAGLVERQPEAADRRVVRVVATERGRQLLNEVFAAREEYVSRVLASMSEEDAEALLRGLEAFRSAITMSAITNETKREVEA